MLKDSDELGECYLCNGTHKHDAGGIVHDKECAISRLSGVYSR